MATIDVLAMDLSIQLLLVLLESSKPLVAVRNVQTTIQSSLQEQGYFCSESKKRNYSQVPYIRDCLHFNVDAKT